MELMTGVWQNESMTCVRECMVSLSPPSLYLWENCVEREVSAYHVSDYQNFLTIRKIQFYCSTAKEKQKIPPCVNEQEMPFTSVGKNFHPL